MRRNSVLENLYASAEGNQLHYGEYDALRAYNLARELDLDYPLVLDINADSPNIMLTTFRNARIGKFYYSCHGSGLDWLDILFCSNSCLGGTYGMADCKA